MSTTLETFLQVIHDDVIDNEWDRIILVIGDEGYGKSTLMLTATWLWQEVRGRDPTPASVLDQVVWDHDGFKNAMATWDRRSAITVQDAPRVLHKKKAMASEQVELETDLLDVRTMEYLIMLGYQDWDLVPSMLQTRRAKNAIYIPSRGTAWLYGRDTLDERVGENSWPDPDTKATFPDLSGTTLWQRFKERDTEQKQQRIKAVDAMDADTAADRMQIKIMLRLVQPWDDDAGLSYREAAQYLDYGRGWISDRVQDWREGVYEGLVDSEEAPIA